MSNSLLARYASCLFWLARMMERSENLARILDVNETFSRDSRGSQNWVSIVDLYSDGKRFKEKYPVASAKNVLRFYVIDTENPGSIVSIIRNARENARTLRPLISTEMWSQLNILYNKLRQVEASSLVPGQLNQLMASIKEACQTHTGITEGTFYRDQGWYFYQLGRYIERADQATRLIDIKYHMLLPPGADVGSAVDISQWNALLRSAAGYHAFRRMHSATVTPARVAGFLLLNQDFPRSVSLCVSEINRLLTEVRSRYGLRSGDPALEVLDELRVMLGTYPIEKILANGLHEFIDMTQLQLIAVTNAMTAAFFTTSAVTEEEPVQTQSQSQSSGYSDTPGQPAQA